MNDDGAAIFSMCVCLIFIVSFIWWGLPAINKYHDDRMIMMTKMCNEYGQKYIDGYCR